CSVPLILLQTQFTNPSIGASKWLRAVTPPSPQPSLQPVSPAPQRRPPVRPIAGPPTPIARQRTVPWRRCREQRNSQPHFLLIQRNPLNTGRLHSPPRQGRQSSPLLSQLRAAR